jgi:hypothetical protein
VVERERVGQKDQKVGKYEDGSEPVIGELIEPSTPLAPTPRAFLIFSILL